MSHTHTYSETMRFQEDSETTIVTTTTNTITDDMEVNLDIAVTTGTEPLYNVDVDASEVTSMYMWCDQGDGLVATAAITANYTAALDTDTQQWLPTANEPFYWHTGLGTVNPWLVDLTTGLYFKNESGSTANFKVRFLLGTA